MSGSIVVMHDVDGAVLGAVGGDLRGPLGRPRPWQPWSPATTSYQYQPPSTNGLSGRSKVKVPPSPSTVAGVDALGVAARHRLVDGDDEPAPVRVTAGWTSVDDGVAAPVGRREGVEVGAEGQQLRRLEPQRGARADLVGVQLAPGRGRLADRGVVEVLGRLVATDASRSVSSLASSRST